MVKKRKFTVIILVLISTLLHAQQYSEYYYKRKELFENTPDTKHEIIFLGNSITEGGNWQNLFPDKNVINRGISGDVTDGILFRLDEVTSSRPEKVFLMVGTNDLARGKSISYVTNNHRIIIEKILKDSENTTLYLQSVLPVNPTVGNRFSGHKSKQKEILDVNANLRALAYEFNISYINLHKRFTNSKGELKPKFTHDGLHLSKKGYQKWKNVLKKYVVSK